MDRETQECRDPGGMGTQRGWVGEVDAELMMEFLGFRNRGDRMPRAVGTTMISGCLQLL